VRLRRKLQRRVINKKTQRKRGQEKRAKKLAETELKRNQKNTAVLNQRASVLLDAAEEQGKTQESQEGESRKEKSAAQFLTASPVERLSEHFPLGGKNGGNIDARGRSIEPGKRRNKTLKRKEETSHAGPSSKGAAWIALQQNRGTGQ